ncbi:MAG TPA: phosphotransacetylase family protein [Nitrospirota bacterium]|nr:phosphotransacetylase family protein [Nitrospirota bacterium]
MIPIFIASNTGYSGRTFVSLGLALKLIEQGFKVGYLKPLGRVPVKKGKDVYDADALFIRETLGLEEPLEVISPFVQTYESQTLLFGGGLRDVRKDILDAFKTLKKKDFVIIGGSSDLFDGSLLGVNALSLIRDMKAYLLMVEPWRGEGSADVLYGSSRFLGERFAGGVINKVPANAVQHVRETVRPFLEKKGVRVFGVFPKDRTLEAVTVRQLNDMLSGKVLCCEDRLDEYVENFSVGAMDVDSALAYFRRLQHKAVITGAHRADIQLAAMETSTQCIILTGGLAVNDVVIGKAQAKGIPIISVEDDTFTTIDKIEVRMGKTSIREKRKVDRVKELMDIELDIKRFLKSMK